MTIDESKFDAEFDKGLSQASAMGRRSTRSTIINLCSQPKTPSKNKPNTIGRLAMIPILDKNMSAIHKVEGYESVTVPVINKDWDESDPNSPQFYWRTYVAVPDYSYVCPLTDSERERIKGLYDLIKDYNNTFNSFGNSIKTVYFMKAFIIKLQSDVSGALYTDLTEPVVIQHNSAEFPKAYASMCKTNDEWGHEWRKELFLPDGDVVNMAICSTSKKDIGYNVSFEFKKGVQTGKTVTRSDLEKWMDFDINTIGVDLTVADMSAVQEAVDNINAAWDMNQDKANAQLSEPAPTSAPTTDSEASPTVELGVPVASPNILEL